MRSAKNQKLYEQAREIAKAMDVQLVTRGMQPHSVVILAGTPEQSVHDVRAELMAHDARWSLGEEYDDDEKLLGVETEPLFERLAERCVEAAAARQGVTVTPALAGELSKDVLKAAWGIDGVTDADERLEMMSRGRKVFWEVVKAAAGDAWSIGESHMQEMDTDFTAVDGDTEVLPLRVLADAVQQKDAYRTLYGEHIALGVLWIPQIRGRVAERLGREPTTREYAKRVKEALGMSEGAWRGVHRLAENHAGVGVLFRMISLAEILDPAVIWSLAEAVNQAFQHGEGWRLAEFDLDGLSAFLRVLKENEAEGVERVLSAHRGDVAYWVALGNALLAAGEIVSAEECSEARMYDAIGDAVVGRVERRNQELLDWLAQAVFVNPGAIVRGYRNVVKGLRGSERVERLTGWAMKKQERWHRDLQATLRREGVEGVKEGVWSRHDEPVEARTDRVEVPGGDGEGQVVWTVQEICSWAELNEEGQAMGHCVLLYGPRCVAGESRIFSLRDNKGRRVSTIELKRKCSGEWALERHKGKRDVRPGAAATRVVEAWLVGMNHRERRT